MRQLHGHSSELSIPLPRNGGNHGFVISSATASVLTNNTTGKDGTSHLQTQSSCRFSFPMLRYHTSISKHGPTGSFDLNRSAG